MEARKAVCFNYLEGNSLNHWLEKCTGHSKANLCTYGEAWIVQFTFSFDFIKASITTQYWQ